MPCPRTVPDDAQRLLPRRRRSTVIVSCADSQHDMVTGVLPRVAQRQTLARARIVDRQA